MSAQKVNDQNGARADKQREVRLGLVMYGGVSLAIYINGVAREFFRAVRGNGVYKLIKALTDSDIVVDVISGTSAGGINGIMLAHALCNGKDFASCANLWRIDGDVRSLLRSPYKAADETESLFDSEGYYQERLEAAFRDMPDYSPEVGEINSTFPELDLFVTGTDVDGNIFTQFDDAGHPIDVKDHRSVFQLKHRAGRKEPFNPNCTDYGPPLPENTYRALAKLARITSCFPAAFTPVRVRLDARDGGSVDGRLQHWGELNKESCFLDGGVIDNKPFTYTIKEIFNRPADRQIERKLFYVEPDPEHFSRVETATQPNFVQAIIASLIGIPGYESIADDLKLLAKHNSKIRQYQRLRKHIESPQDESGVKKKTTPEVSETQLQLYERCGLIAISDRVIEGILKDNGRAELLSDEARRAAAALVTAFDLIERRMMSTTAEPSPSPVSAEAKPAAAGAATTGVVAPAGGAPGAAGQGAPKKHPVPTTLRNFDVHYRLRRLYRTVYKLEETIRDLYGAGGDGASEINRYVNLWRLLNRQIELLEIVNVNMERLVDETPISWKKKLVELTKRDQQLGGGGASSQALVNLEAALIWNVVSASLQELLDVKSEAATLLTPTFEGVYAALDKDPKDPKVIERYSTDFLSQVNAELKDARKKIGGRINQITEDVKSKRPEQREKASREFVGIFKLTSGFEKEIIKRLLPNKDDKTEQRVRAAYEEFQLMDAQLFPLEFVAELNEKDIIETIRISPRDAEKGFSNKGLSDKVSGDALYHFGGFFKRSWRSNDILWGRLDSLCQIVETLLDPERIKSVLGNGAQFARVRGLFFAKTPPEGENPAPPARADWQPGMHPEELFGNAGETTQKELRDWLVRLLWRAAPRSAAELAGLEDLKGNGFKVKMSRIIEAAQLEVLHEDLPNVISDALEEQARWNQFRFPRLEYRPPGLVRKALSAGEQVLAGKKSLKEIKDRNPFVFTPTEANLDPFVSVLAAAGAAHDTMLRFEQSPTNKNPHTPMHTDLGTFFRTGYRIGSEDLLRDMPLLVLLEIVSVSLLVLRNCVLKVLGPNAARIKSHPLYVALIEFPLRAFNTVVLFMRRVPSSRKSLPIGLFILALLLLFIGVMWHDSIIWEPKVVEGKPISVFHLLWFVVFLAAPLVTLSSFAVYLFRGRVSEHIWRRLLLYAVPGFFALLPLFFVLVGFGGLHEATVDATIRRASSMPWVVAAARFAAAHVPFWPGGRAVVSWAVTATFALTIFSPLVTLLIARLFPRKRNKPEDLRDHLQKYFSIQEMLLIIRRLKLFRNAELRRLARQTGYFSEDDLTKLSQRLTKLLLDAGPLPEGARPARDPGRPLRKRTTAEKLGVRCEEAFKLFNEIEREERRRAYVELRRRLEARGAEDTAEAYKGLLDTLKEHRGGDGARPRAAGSEADGDAEVMRAIERFYRRVRRIEEERMRAAEKAIENTRFSPKAAEAGRILAQRIVERAWQLDERDPPERESDGVLARLEHLMYSINPEAMR
jgi:patatin-related protein